MATSIPVFVCFVALREEMSNINTRLEGPNVQYMSGKFDGRRPRHTYEINRRYAGKVEVTFVVLGEMGNIGTAATVAAVVNELMPQAAFILGIAGTLDIENAKLGDVVVSSVAKFIGPNKISKIDKDRMVFSANLPMTNVVDSADGTIVNNDGQSDTQVGLDAPPVASEKIILNPIKKIGDYNWLRFRRHAIEIVTAKEITERFKNHQKEEPVPLLSVGLDIVKDESLQSFLNLIPSIRTGAVLGSEWVVDSEEFNDFLIQRNATDAEDFVTLHGDEFDKSQQLWSNDDISCLDMESYGFFRAIDEQRRSGGQRLMHAFSIRGISDPCRNKKGVEHGSRSQIRKIAVHNAVETLVDFIYFYVRQDVGRGQR